MEALNRLAPEEFAQAQKLPLVLVLDNVRSGLNVGSIFRTADAFALEKVLLTGITATPPHREILKTALGSTDSVAWEYVGAGTAAVAQLKATGYRVLAVEQTTEKTWLQNFKPDPRGKYALVFGNEVDGVSDAILQLCDGALEIPQFGTKHSLNIAVAAGIVIWDISRQLRF